MQLQIGLSRVLHVRHLAQHSAYNKCLINLASTIFFMRCYFRHVHILRRHLTVISIKTRNKIHNNVSAVFQAYYTKMRPNKHQKKIEEKNKSVTYCLEVRVTHCRKRSIKKREIRFPLNPMTW